MFDALAEAPEPLGADAVAGRLGTSSRGTELLLGTCVSLKLLQVRLRRGKGECPREGGVSSAPPPHPCLQRAGESVSFVCYRLLPSAFDTRHVVSTRGRGGLPVKLYSPR